MRTRTLAAAVSLLVTVVSLFAQSRIPVTGKYEGTADVEGMGKLAITAELLEKDGKVSGVFRTPLGDAEILKGSVSSGVLSLTVDAGGDDLLMDGKIAGGGSIAGQITVRAAKGAFELRRIGDLSPAAGSGPVTRQSKDKWRGDLRFIAAELPKRHKNAFHHISKEKWESEIAKLDARIGSLPDDEIIVEMGRIVSLIGDGHTGLGWAWTYPRLPIRFFIFGRETRVIQVGNEYPQLIGAKVLSINGQPVDALHEKSRAYISAAESESYILDTSPYLLTFPVFLKALAGSGPADGAEIEFLEASGRKSTVRMTSKPRDARIEWVQAYKAAPLSLQKPELPFYFEYLKEAKTVYVNFRWYPRNAEFRKFSSELFDFVDRNEVDKLVFDFRYNGGGDFTRGREFFVKPIKERKKFLERGRLFALVGRRTYSAAMVNAADFRNDLGAILVGEPTGARPNGYQEGRSVALPNSRLNLSYSVEYYKFSENDTAGLLPDKVIAPDWDSYMAGRDVTLEWVAAYPKGK